jgi:hypothetical protein
MNNGYIKSENIDFYICFNGNMKTEIYQDRSNKMGLENIIFCNRENKGYDFSGWSEILYLEKNGKKLYEIYDYYIFINSTCMGPFVPLYIDRNWIDIFTSMITDEIKLVGPTINLLDGLPHIQPYMFCTDRIGCQIGINQRIFGGSELYELSKVDLIYRCEIGFSIKILESGYKIKSLLKAQSNIDYKLYYDTKILPEIPYGIPYETSYDNCYEKSYCGISFHPYEVIFFKSNRDISPNLLKIYYNLHMKNNIDLFDKIFGSGINQADVKENKIDKIIIVIYGEGLRYKNITAKFIELFVKNNKIIVPLEYNFNTIFGDPSHEIIKNIEIMVYYNQSQNKQYYTICGNRTGNIEYDI